MKKLVVNTSKAYMIPDGCKVIKREGISLLQTETGDLILFETVPHKAGVEPPPFVSSSPMDENSEDKWDARVVETSEHLKIGEPSKDNVWCYECNNCNDPQIK